VAGRTITVDGRSIEIGNPDKVLFPESELTQADLADYYRRVAPSALPHLKGRPLSMQRFPDGIGASGFFQKDIPDYFPDWIGRAELSAEDGTVTYVVAEDAATLVYLANQACITPHVGLSRVDRPDVPDRLIFDLDPSDDDFAKVQRTAQRLKALLDRIELPSFVMLTGSRGLHVVVPLDRKNAFDEVRAFARSIADHLAARHEDEITAKQRKAARADRVFVDYLRNAYGQTTVAPYGVRAREGAPVATPIDWSEAGSGTLQPERYTIRNLFRRLAQKPDPWRDIDKHRASLARAIKALGAMQP